MFASARTATAGSPLASPSLKHVFEFAHAHTHAHVHSPLVGLGITNVNMVGRDASDDTFSSTHTGRGSGQPVMQRHRFPRMQTSDNVGQIPCTPRLESAPTLPSVFSPFFLSPTTTRSPLIAEGYYSDDNVPSEDTGGTVSSSQPINNHATAYRRLTTTTNNPRSTLRSSIHTSYQEIERIGLGISGILLKESSITDNVDVGMFTDVSANAVGPPSNLSQRRMTVRPHSKRVVKFKTPEQIVVPSNTSDESDGYTSDAEHEDGLDSYRRARRRLSALTGLRPCKDHVPTPYYGPNGESSWL